MRSKLIPLLTLSILSFLAACSSGKSVTKNKLDSPIISLSKSKCFGKCKVYEVKIYSDQTITYQGIMFVDSIGLFEGRIEENDLNLLVNQFEKINFNSLDSSYLVGSSDVQKITLGFNQQKVVYNNRAASDSLKAITTSIDEIIEKMNWY